MSTFYYYLFNVCINIIYFYFYFWFFSIGEIVNFISTDTRNLVNACNSFHSMWSVPFQVKQ